ncbi:ATP-dependent DNA ligase [Achromobacter sp. GG226]|uniref:ATP-dependent DNA ligase n=1 Tax=Verticiella alkaliphila TaxID=2779529 RepID=UPI001C0DD9D7|nr:ATP-dependent DNA ligase [Verticiella sp. GG226]MBU4611821.1 ATP-dependent DNA ligase [Verticiella sp. GG226]
MNAFADLYAALDATTSTNAKRAALEAYFGSAPAEDAAWAVYFLAGGKPRQIVPTRVLRAFAQTEAGIPEWLFEESYHAVGDLAETIALLLPGTERTDSEGLAHWMEHRLLPLRGLPPEILHERLREGFAQLDTAGRFVFAKLITGAMRVGVSKLLVTRALAAVAGVDAKRIAQRLIGYTDRSATPTADGFAALVSAEEAAATGRDAGQPYPFFLAHPLQLPLSQFGEQLGTPEDWLVEWKWDGIRAQVVQRDGRGWVWSRGEELVTDRFPELAAMAERLPYGTVVDGEILVWEEGAVQSFARLQRRLGRKTVSARLLKEQPVVLLAYDLLETEGEDWRSRPQHERRAALERLVAQMDHPGLQLSPRLHEDTWDALAVRREESRGRGVEGLMLKARNAHYGVGRTRDVGVWWKWKIDPITVDAVLLYAQPGSGRRANLYTDYTFAVWDGPPGQEGRNLVPFAKAYSGLTDAEIRKVDAIVRKTTKEKFGPVRSLEPTLVFELGFEGIARSTRHKSGVAVRFPRMLRWRLDKPIAEADTLDQLNALVAE